MIDLTLARLKRPALADFNPVFGTVVAKTDRNKGGLSTEEVDANMALSYELMREVEVYNSDETSKIEYDAKMAFMGDNPITLTVKNATYAGCTIQITHRGSQPCQIQWNDTEVLEMVRGDTLNLIWNETQWDRINNKNSSTTDANGVNYTFVVDSDESLREWAENSRINNQDYTSVLIRRGTWTSTTGVNLTTAGTKVVQGEPGSKLSFNAVEKGLFYDSAPITSDYWMRDVSVENNSGNNRGNDIVSYGFSDCNNLTNCVGTGTGTGTGTGITSGQGHGFYGCNNLTNCTGTGTGTGHGYISGSNTITGQGYGYGFSNCNNLTNCTGTGTGTITNTTTDTGQGYGFSNCNNLTNCVGTGTGTGATNDKGYGFSNCGNLTNCTGTGTGTGQGYGFNICYRLSGCKKGKKCSTSVFSNAFASFADAGMETYACANTPNGGFNDSTNY